jgi:hypothetical protein
MAVPEEAVDGSRRDAGGRGQRWLAIAMPRWVESTLARLRLGVEVT